MLDLIDTRNRHFIETARRIIAAAPSGRSVDLSAVAAQTAMSPAPHYYCTYTYALRMLRVLRHGRLKLRRDRRYEMWVEINGKCDALMQRRGCRLPEALAHVLAYSSASQFFIAPSTALRLLTQL